MNSAYKKKPDSGTIVYRYILCAMIISTLWLTFAMLMKLAAHEFQLWKSIGLHSVFLKSGINLPEQFEFLSDLSWMSPHSKQRLLVYYLKHLYVQYPIIFILIYFKHSFVKKLADLETWLHNGQFRREKSVLGFFVMLIFVAEMSLTPLGFNWPGFWGWTFHKTQNIDEQCSPSFEEEVPEFLYKGMILENSRFLPKAGCVNGIIQFLHFEEGEILPWNYELVNLVFPGYYFKPKTRPTHEAGYRSTAFRSVSRCSLGGRARASR